MLGDDNRFRKRQTKFHGVDAQRVPSINESFIQVEDDTFHAPPNSQHQPRTRQAADLRMQI